MPDPDMTTESSTTPESGLSPAEQAVAIVKKTFNGMELKEDTSSRTVKTKNLDGGTIVEVTNEGKNSDSFTVSFKEERNQYLLFALASQGLTYLRIHSLRTSVGAMTIKREMITLSENDLKGRSKLPEAALALANWLAQVISENKYAPPPLQAEAELD